MRRIKTAAQRRNYTLTGYAKASEYEKVLTAVTFSEQSLSEFVISAVVKAAEAVLAEQKIDTAK